MGEQVVAHAVLRFARGVQHQVTRAGAERCLERGETDDEECESQDVLELSSRTPERIDDRADEPRWHDRRERASGREDSAGDELEAVASKVMEEGGAGRGHSVTSVLGRIPLSRAFLLRIQTPPTTIAAATKTGATPQTSATGPTMTRSEERRVGKEGGAGGAPSLGKQSRQQKTELVWGADFFFQAEDGIRDDLVTGVQTCALPICGARSLSDECTWANSSFARVPAADPDAADDDRGGDEDRRDAPDVGDRTDDDEIGRASCRERGWSGGGAVAGKTKQTTEDGTSLGSRFFFSSRRRHTR